MKMSKLSNQTNSQDPQAVNSRVFVGNLNTFQCSKTDVEKMFQRYGRLAGISMHKGYAFVQFTNPVDARNACYGEDGRTVLSQVLDVNMVAEPKSHQIGRNRQNGTKTGNDWDYYYDSYYTSTLFPSTPTVPAVKRQRLMSNPQVRSTLVPTIPTMVVPTHQAQNGLFQFQQAQQQQPQLLYNSTSNLNLCNNFHSQSSTSFSNNLLANGSSCTVNHNSCTNNNSTSQLLGPFKVYSSPDILICGNCREMFTELGEIIEHKRTYCKLRFTCKCRDELSVLLNKNSSPSNGDLEEEHKQSDSSDIEEVEGFNSNKGIDNENFANDRKSNKRPISSEEVPIDNGDALLIEPQVNGKISPIDSMSSSRSNSPTESSNHVIPQTCILAISIVK